jgi:hypothetical protein
MMAHIIQQQNTDVAKPGDGEEGRGDGSVF